MHTAQNRNLPREVFEEVADIMAQDMTLFPSRNGRPRQPRFANGQEEIVLNNGGSYRLVAPTRGGARGPSNDDVIIDELREMEDHDYIAAAKPTLSASPDPQMIYLSNAGTDDSVVLNGIRLRAESDPNLAYLEWSAAPDRASDDRTGWLEANPAIGYLPRKMENLERDYVSHKLEGTLALFEVEYLCRWVPTLREKLVDAYAWAVCEAPTLTAPRKAAMGISMDPDGTRASAALAWQQPDGTVALQLLYDVRGTPIDTDALGADLRARASKEGATMIGFDPLTDAELAKFFKKPEPLSGQKFANASARFVTAVLANRLRWNDAGPVTDDLVWTSRKPHDESGSFQAVRAQDERPITAALAAIRAVWLASGPRPPRPRIY
jgi:hypothetical protein